MLRHVSLILVLVFGAWALWPREAPQDEGAPAGGATGGAPRKYTIRFAPGIYMPGRRPMDLGQPLKALAEVAAEFEALHPDTRIEFTEAPVNSREYLVTQLSAGQAPDILNVNVEDVWQDVQKGWYVALDPYLEAPNPFVSTGELGSRQWWDLFKYQGISRGKAAPDGKMYCITLDMVETGIFYNKDIFRRLGLSPPRDWADFERIQMRIQEAGITSMLVGVSELSDWGVDLMFDQMYAPILSGIDLAQDPVREVYLDGYLDWDEIAFLNTKGFFTRRDPRYVETFRLLKSWRRFFAKTLGGVDMLRNFVTRKGAMYWSGSWTVNRLERDPDVGFEWGVFYLPAVTKETHPYADGHPMVVIGGSGTQLELTNSAFSDTGDPASSTKLKRCVAFLQFLTLPKNTQKVVNEILAFLPNVVGAEPRTELLPFHEILQRRYTTTKWTYTFDLRFNEIMRRMLDLYLNDGIDESEFMRWMESNVRSASQTIVRRKRLDLSKFEARWRELAPVRERMQGLPAAP